MKFFQLPEAHINCSHVLLRSALLYRLDARDVESSIVVNDYADRPPYIEIHGDMQHARSQFEQALQALIDFPQRALPWYNPRKVPLFTLDVRPSAGYEVLVAAYADGNLGMAVHGDVPFVPFQTVYETVEHVRNRLTALWKIHYAAE